MITLSAYVKPCFFDDEHWPTDTISSRDTARIEQYRWSLRFGRSNKGCIDIDKL